MSCSSSFETDESSTVFVFILFRFIEIDNKITVYCTQQSKIRKLCAFPLQLNLIIYMVLLMHTVTFAVVDFDFDFKTI